MSVTIRRCVTDGWEVDIRVLLPDGTVIRERKKAPTHSESNARRWAEARERHLLLAMSTVRLMSDPEPTRWSSRRNSGGGSCPRKPSAKREG